MLPVHTTLISVPAFFCFYTDLLYTIVFYAPNAKVPPGITGVDVCGCRITPQPTVRDIGIFLDSLMDMTMQVTHRCQAVYFQLHNIAKIRHCLTTAACKTIVHGLVTSKLDYFQDEFKDTLF